MTQAQLILQDGSVFRGTSFGAAHATSGEVVFNTGMVGYPETLTDPSYAGQILTFTYPLMGNYGVPATRRDQFGILKYFESEKIHVRGVIVSEHCSTPSHWSSQKTLHQWLLEHNIPGLYGIDTRMLTQKLREHGVMLGEMLLGSNLKALHAKNIKITDPNTTNLVADVSINKPITYSNGPKRVVLIDCGAKLNILRSLLARKLTVIRVPWNYDFSRESYHGIVISNGPGDPVVVQETITCLKLALQGNKPLLGICLGNQLLALAAGAKTYKLKFGHRSQNQPCRETGTKRCYITSQNHGYTVDAKTLPHDWHVWFTNANDGSVEGIKHKTMPFMAVQFHPEATPGPEDSGWIFDKFVRIL